jgi:hypothetical protein
MYDSILLCFCHLHYFLCLVLIFLIQVLLGIHLCCSKIVVLLCTVLHPFIEPTYHLPEAINILNSLYCLLAGICDACCSIFCICEVQIKACVIPEYRCFFNAVHFLLSLSSSALDKERKTKVAIKKIGRPLQTPLHAKRAYREIRMLKHMHHDNVRLLKTLCIYNCLKLLCGHH